jgi:hypothetical protein
MRKVVVIASTGTLQRNSRALKMGEGIYFPRDSEHYGYEEGDVPFNARRIPCCAKHSTNYVVQCQEEKQKGCFFGRNLMAI